MSCCFQFVYDFKDIFNNNMIICSKPHKGYRCQIKKNYIQETLTNKCLDRLKKSILFVFDNQKNPKSSLIGNPFPNTRRYFLREGIHL